MAIRRRYINRPHRPLHVKEHLTHLAHDPRFWAFLLLAVFVILTIIALLFSEPQPRGAYYYPMYLY